MISIDSFKIRLPIDDVQILDHVLLQVVDHVVRETGETISSETKNKHFYELPALKLEVTKESQYYKKDQLGDFITLKITSKHLKEKYFEGITFANIEFLYNSIIDFKAVSFALETLLSAECTDIDFKLDYDDTTNSFLSMLDYLATKSKPSKLQGRGYLKFNQANNKGLQFSNRETTDFVSNPYCKFYHKGLEITSKSREFYDMYLQGQAVTNKIRQEVTLKNKKHLKHYGIESSRLSDLLELSQTKLQDIMNNITSIHIEKRFTRIAGIGESPSDKILSLLVNSLLELKYIGADIIELITEGMTKNAKSRYTHQIMGILEAPGNKSKLEINDNLERMLNRFNLISR